MDRGTRAETIVGAKGAVEPFRNRSEDCNLVLGFNPQCGEERFWTQPSRNTIRKWMVDGCLKRLGRINYIDLFYQHRVDPNVPIEDVRRAP